jgi:hypothetical protein
LAILFITLFLCCAIVSIILAGIDYQLAGPNWKPIWPWYSLPGLQIACIIYTFVIVVFGYIAFTRPNIGCTIAFSILLLISLLFNLAIAIFSLIAGSEGWVNTYFGCNGKFSGVMEVWQGIDSYLQQVDQNLCSPNCPCSITNTQGYTNNPTIAPIFNSWTKTQSNSGAINFQQCSAQIQRNAYLNAVQNDALFDPQGNFDASRFVGYMSRVENKFQCSGWCNITYVDPTKQSTTAMFKYMFNDVNLGPPQNFGCLNSLITWLPPYLKAFGSVTMVLFGLQSIVLILALCQCWARERDHEHQIPHHHDDNRK